MRYSLLSRFQAGLWGAVIGEKLSLGEGKIKSEETPLSFWSQIALKGVHSFGKRDGLVWEDWRQQDNSQTATSSETAIATLAIALYFHDSRSFLRKQLTEAAKIWLDPRAEMTDVLIWGEAIALALTERLEPMELIPTILTDPEIALTPLAQQLDQVQHFLTNRTPLQRVVSSLKRFPSQSCTPIALALYCFLSTPEDFSVCVSRAVESQYKPNTTAPLAGILSGVYNGFSAVPLSWRFALSQQLLLRDIDELAWRLFSVWSGVYVPLEQNEKLLASAIAAPRIIQPRSTLPVISQRE